MSTKPFIMKPPVIIRADMRPSEEVQRSLHRKEMVKDYPGRVQVQEGCYDGGGARSAFVGRSDGDLGMGLPGWPVENTNPFGKK